MTNYYFLDSCIWRDYVERRHNLFGKDLSGPVYKMFLKIIKKKDVVVYSSLILRELNNKFTKDEIEEILNLFYYLKILKKADITQFQIDEAKLISIQRELPLADVLHAIVARDNDAILVSRDKHFLKLTDLVKIIRPEDIL